MLEIGVSFYSKKLFLPLMTNDDSYNYLDGISCLRKFIHILNSFYWCW